MSAMRRVQLGYFLNLQRFSQSLSCYTPKSGLFGSYTRNCSTSIKNDLSESEKMEQKLHQKFPKAKKISVNDVSGGCGSMYEIFVETIEFKGLPLVKQHESITKTLKSDIKAMHGLTIKTKVADAEGPS